MTAWRWLLLIVSLTSAHLHAKVVSDRLVDQLNCEHLSTENIYQSIRPGAFSRNLHLPAVNWSSGYLGECWSLARTQRLMFYLGRTNSGTGPVSNQILYDVLTMIRGSYPDQIDASPSPRKDGAAIEEARVRDYQVFSIPDPNFAGDFYQSLRREFDDPTTARPVRRGFRPDVEAFQTWRFHQPGNLEMGLGSWSRGPAQNLATFNQLMRDLDLRRLVLVNLRAEQRVQHVVVVKGVQKTLDGSFAFIVYDSNRPFEDRYFTYSPQTQEFDGSGTMDLFYPGGLSRPVGVFIVDDAEYKLIDRALLRHYTAVCK